MDELTQPVLEEPLNPNAPAMTVDISKPAVAPVAEPPVPDKKPGETDQAYLRRLTDLENRSIGAGRILNRLSQQITELDRKINIPAPVPTQPAPATPTDEVEALLFSGDPSKVKQGISRLAEQQAQAMYDKQELLRQQLTWEQNRQSAFEQSRRWAETRYPQLHRETGSEDDPFSKIFVEVVNSHPEWHQDPYGPKLAVQEAEELAKSRGVKLAPVQSQIGPNQELVRRSRVNAGSLPPSRGTVSDDKVTLTQEELSIIKTNHLDPVQYAKGKRSNEQGAF